MEDKVKVTTDSKSSASVIEPGWTDVLLTGKVHEKGRGGADDSDEDVARMAGETDVACPKREWLTSKSCKTDSDPSQGTCPLGHGESGSSLPEYSIIVLLNSIPVQDPLLPI